MCKVFLIIHRVRKVQKVRLYMQIMCYDDIILLFRKSCDTETIDVFLFSPTIVFTFHMIAPGFPPETIADMAVLVTIGINNW